MCGRYTITSSEVALQGELDLVGLPVDYRPRYNIAPTQPVLALVARDGEFRAGWLRWGLIPYWAKDPAIGNRLINARGETVHEKPSFRTAFEQRRCLIVADGFYEWRREGTAKVPVWIHRQDRRPFTFAGLWDRWQGADGEQIVSCTIVTTEANDFLRPIHERMPVILPKDERLQWVDPTADRSSLRALLRSYEADDLRYHAVSTLVNSPANDLPECIEPIEADLSPASGVPRS